MGRKSNDFKFIVGEPDGLHSKVWSVKLRNGDIYIMTNRGNWHKISLHKSGMVHSAITKEKYDFFGMTQKQRLGAQWNKALNINECGNMFNIIFPHSELYCNALDSVPEKTMKVSISSENKSIVIAFLKLRTHEEQVTLELSHTEKIHILHTVKIDKDHYLITCYYYTNRFDTIIKNCRDKLKQHTENIPKPKEGIKLTSGFVTITDTTYQTPYYIEFNINQQPESWSSALAQQSGNCYEAQGKDTGFQFFIDLKKAGMTD